MKKKLSLQEIKTNERAESVTWKIRKTEKINTCNMVLYEKINWHPPTGITMKKQREKKIEIDKTVQEQLSSLFDIKRVIEKRNEQAIPTDLKMWKKWRMSWKKLVSKPHIERKDYPSRSITKSLNNKKRQHQNQMLSALVSLMNIHKIDKTKSSHIISEKRNRERIA